MPWNPENYERTMYILRLNRGGKVRYVVYPMMTVLHDNGQVYSEPVPYKFLTGIGDFNVNKVEFIDEPSVRRDADASQHNLVAVFTDGSLRGNS